MTPAKKLPHSSTVKPGLDPSRKAALKVMLMANELMDIDHDEGIALLDKASNLLSKRRAEPSQIGARAEEESWRKDDVAKEALHVIGHRVESVDAEPETQPENQTLRVIRNLWDVAGSGSDEEIEKAVRTLREYFGLLPEPEEVIFDEIDVEDGARRAAEERQTRRIARFDKGHHGQNYFAKGDIWGKVGLNSPYRDADGKIRKKKGRCDRCREELKGPNVWLCEVGLCGTMICRGCWEE